MADGEDTHTYTWAHAHREKEKERDGGRRTERWRKTERERPGCEHFWCSQVFGTRLRYRNCFFRVAAASGLPWLGGNTAGRPQTGWSRNMATWQTEEEEEEEGTAINLYGVRRTRTWPGRPFARPEV